MSAFADQLMVRYLDSAKVGLLLVPQADANRDRMRALLAEVYEPRVLTVEAVDSVTVGSKRFQIPVVEPVGVRGTWDKVIPNAERALVNFEVPNVAQTSWIDMALETTVSVRVSVNSGALESAAFEDVAGLTQQQFVSKFAFLDLPALMQASNVATYQELQEDFPRLFRLHYADPPAYDPNDPAAERTYRLRISVLFFATLDLESALRRLAQASRAFDEMRPRVEEYEGGALLASSAWMGVFPASAFTPPVPPITQDDVAGVLAAEGFVAAFETV